MSLLSVRLWSHWVATLRALIYTSLMNTLENLLKQVILLLFKCPDKLEINRDFTECFFDISLGNLSIFLLHSGLFKLELSFFFARLGINGACAAPAGATMYPMEFANTMPIGLAQQSSGLRVWVWVCIWQVRAWVHLSGLLSHPHSHSWHSSVREPSNWQVDRTGGGTGSWNLESKVHYSHSPAWAEPAAVGPFSSLDRQSKQTNGAFSLGRACGWLMLMFCSCFWSWSSSSYRRHANGAVPVAAPARTSSTSTQSTTTSASASCRTRVHNELPSSVA